MGAAVDYLTALGMENIHVHTQSLAAYALDKLRSIDGLAIHGAAEVRAGVIPVTMQGIHAHDLAQLLDAEGVAVRAGLHCAHPLHACMSLPATTRASFYLYNTFEEVDRLADALNKAYSLFHRK